MSDKNEQTSSRARPSSTSAWTQRPLQRGRTWARTLIAVTAILALGGLGPRSVAASGRSLALGSGRSGILSGVSADSATDAWAVGAYFNPTTFASETLALHWNGTKWSKVASPNPGGTTSSSDVSSLNGVSANSATDAWAVGAYTNPTTGASETLALHWNGTKWSTVSSPNPGGTTSSSDFTSLSGVSANSATDAWAVGYYGSNGLTQGSKTLVLHWNGTSWSKVASPNPGGTTSSGASTLAGVSADSATDAWAVGSYSNPITGASETLALHWNGSKWSTVLSPNPGGTTSSSDVSILSGVSADSATDAWAIGWYANPTTGATETLALHWNGTSWSKVASPNPGGTSSFDISYLNGVSADSATDAWAVGYYFNPTTFASETLALHWNGTKWSKVASPNPGGTTSSSDDSYLFGVSADSAPDASAVGYFVSPTTGAGETLVLRWNGTSWSTA
jgi:hypothetical protein